MTLFSVSSEVITLALAIYGSVVSTLIYVYDRRIRIKVTVTNNIDMPDFKKAIVIQAANIGTRGTSLGSEFLEFPQNFKMWFPEGLWGASHRRMAPDPYEFAPGKPDLMVVIDSKAVAASIREDGFSGLVPFKACFSGAGGKKYKSKEKLLNADTGFVISKSLYRAIKARLSCSKSSKK
jgi:hypothetical protein